MIINFCYPIQFNCEALKQPLHFQHTQTKKVLNKNQHLTRYVTKSTFVDLT